MIWEVNLGIALTDEAQAKALDEGYKLEPYEGHFRNRYVMGVRPAGPRPLVQRILAAVETIFGHSKAEILGENRNRNLVQARQAAMWATWKLGLSTPRAGRCLCRDATTVWYGRRRCEAIQSRDMGYRRACERLLEVVR